MNLLDWQDSEFLLGVKGMDQTHREFVDLLNLTGVAQKSDFPAFFAQLLEHTERHFEEEKKLMRSSGFAAIGEHLSEHDRILGELTHLNQQVQRGKSSLARAYVKDKLPDWFKLHAATMDSALAAHLKIQ